MSEVLQTFVEAIVGRVRKTGDDYNPAELSRPVAILWPDQGREWEALAPALRARLPILTLGPYDPATRTGPAYWIRCMLARVLDDRLPEDEVPVVYLPGVSKRDIRGVEECKDELKPIASLQYEGTLFTQLNGKDWTVAAFIQSADGGLGISMGSDEATRKAALRALTRLAEVPVEEMRKDAPLRAAYFDLKFNPDEALALLRWMNDPDAVRKEHDQVSWDAYVSLCRQHFGLDPEKDGVLKAGQRLGERLDAAWNLARQRWEEAPANYPGLPDLLRRARPKKDLGMFARQDTWPQDNEAAEGILRERLRELGNKQPQEGRAELLELEEAHGRRRDWVWAKLGQAPLARALEHLAGLAKLTEQPLVGADVTDVAEGYAAGGWQADAASLRALSAVETSDDAEAVGAAVRAVYRPWLEEAAVHFQARVGDGTAARYPFSFLPAQGPGTCVVFIDGLRMDVAHLLADHIGRAGLRTEISWRLTGLPTVTATAKPAASPIGASFRSGTDLSPATITGSKVEAPVLRRLLQEADFQVLSATDPLGDPSGKGWSEDGDLDETGHTKGSGLARQLDPALRDISARVRGLLEAGWKTVTIVTDHGFLLMPGGLPKVQLPEHLTEVRKGRCARLKPASSTDLQTVAWQWDSEARFAVPPGIACFEAGKEYEHGGLSPQECVTPVVTITKPKSLSGTIEIEGIRWRGLRCTFSVKGAPTSSRADIRREAANDESSVTGGGRPIEADGACSLLVPDEDIMGEDAYLVVVGASGSLLVQSDVIVGGAA